jgi:hypothetical protein
MNIVVRLRCRINYAVDSYDIDGKFIDLRRTSTSGKLQLTKLPIEDVLDIESPSTVDNPMHSIRNWEQIETGGLSIETVMPG